jgi:hypothetical protein
MSTLPYAFATVMPSPMDVSRAVAAFDTFKNLLSELENCTDQCASDVDV